MRIIIDTNVAVSGLLWQGASNQILKSIRDSENTLLLSDSIVNEFRRVIKYSKFKSKINELKTNPEEILSYYQNLGIFIAINKKANVRLMDKDDRIFLDLAINGNPKIIVSGDGHLLELIKFNNIPIVTPSEAIKVFKKFN